MPAILAILVAACGGPPTGAMSISPAPVAIRPSTTLAPSPTRQPATPEPVACPVASAPGEPVALDEVGSPAVPALLELFERHPVVAIGERHGWQAEHDVLAALVCDPAFPSSVDAMVVEFGNRRLQPILDRYVSGDDVTADELASVWRESTQRSGVWEHPAYRRLFGLVRSVNADLAPADRIRMLAGDPPVPAGIVLQTGDCDERDPACADHWPRDPSMAEVVRDALDRGERVLLIAGAGHVVRRLESGIPPSVAQLVETTRPGSVFVVVPGSGFGEAAGDADERLHGGHCRASARSVGPGSPGWMPASSRGSPALAGMPARARRRRGSARSPTATCCSSDRERLAGERDGRHRCRPLDR